MKLDEVKKYRKKDLAPTFSIKVYRKIGLYLTWVLINAFPRINPNNITLLMFVSYLGSALLLGHSITNKSYLYLFIAALFCGLGESLDCVDGNIARIRNKKSIKGIIYDRLVHNVTGPMIVLAIGLSIYGINNHLSYGILFIIAAIMTELSPIDSAFKDVETLFMRQILYEKTSVYSIEDYPQIIRKEKTDRRIATTRTWKRVLKKMTRILHFNYLLMVGVCVDFALFPYEFYLTLIIGICIILYRLTAILSITEVAGSIYLKMKKLEENIEHN